MASNIRSSGTAALRYASALVDMAMESGALPQIEKDVADLRAMLAGSQELQSMIRSPLVRAAEQQAVLASIAEQAKLSALTGNFLMLLAANRRLPALDSILKAVLENIASRRGELRAGVESAAALSPAQTKSIEDNLSKAIGRPVSVEASIDPTLIGGVVITLGSLMIDDSVKSKLERLGRAMKHDANKAA